jgi:hypothetical protein
MSLVLLVSLAAFALLMNSYQVEVMNEVTRTVSNAGKATLKTFIFHTDDARPGLPTVISGGTRAPGGPHTTAAGRRCAAGWVRTAAMR